MTTAIQSIFIPSHEPRTSPKPHTVYRIEIRAHVRQWTIWRRYSEFVDLHTELCRTPEIGEPPEPLPGKHAVNLKSVLTFGGLGAGVGMRDEKALEERRVALERYLRAMLSVGDERWRESWAFKEFLGVPTGRPGAGGQTGQGAVATTTTFTASTWLDEHTALQAQLRSVWASIHARDAYAAQNDVVSAHKSNVGAKTQLAGVLSRIGVLGRNLEELAGQGMSEGEVQRRTDMVARLQDDCEKVGRVVSVARFGQGAGKSLASVADRSALLGSGSGAPSKPARRVFGAPAQETETTRPLDNTGLVSLQQQRIDQQDTQLSQLTTILQRQRQLGEAINSEVAQQIEMLDDLDSEVDRVGGNLKKAKTNLNKLG